MSRKQVVIIEWIVLLLVLFGAAALGIRALLPSKGSSGEEKTAFAESGTAAAEKEPQTSSEAEEAAPDAGAEAEDAGNDASGEAQPAEEEAGPLRTYTFSFAGDCTIGSLYEWQGNEPGDFQSVVGTNFSYPLSHVLPIFSADDLTMVNLEGTFTYGEDPIEKPYRFKSDPVYVQVLTEGSVEAVSASNNHAGDFQQEGINDTLSTLDGAGIWYARAGSPMIRELDGGLKLGVVSYNTVENWEGEDVWSNAVYNDIQTCREAGCDLIIGFMHWGTVEYLTEPEDWEVYFAHEMVDWGCDMIVGGHAHILQRMEYYNDVPIFYSMGNFCYGGHLNPADKDSVIVQAEFTRNSETGEVSRTGLRVIPCLVSSVEDRNDYCPTPCQEGSEAWQRIRERLEWTGQ